MTRLADLENFAPMNPPEAWQSTGDTAVRKPTFGSVGSQHVRFEEHQEYSSADSILAGKEVRRPVDLCLIQNDKFTTVPLRVGRPPDKAKEGDRGITSELTREQQVALAPLYERFKTQRGSDETDVLDWDVLTENERRLLVSGGIFSVEQLASFSDEQLYRLGPGGPDLRERAKRHMVTKNERKGPDYSGEIKTLQAEKTELSERLAKLEAMYHEREAEREKPKPKPWPVPKPRDTA